MCMKLFVNFNWVLKLVWNELWKYYDSALTMITDDYDSIATQTCTYLAHQLQLQFQFRLWFELFLIGKVVHIVRTIILFFHAYFIVHNLFGREARQDRERRNNGKSSQTFNADKRILQDFCSERRLKKFLKDVGNEECNELRRRLVLPPYNLAKQQARGREGKRKGWRRGTHLHSRYDLLEAVWGHDFNFSNDKRIFWRDK